MRLRIRLTDWPRLALVLTDTPRHSCPDCAGRGVWSEDYADWDGEYGGTTTVGCDCWTTWKVQLLPVPLWLARLFGYRPPGYSSEPPF